MENRESRVSTSFEVRAEDDGVAVVEGYASVFNEDTNIGGQFLERIAPGAFTDAVTRDDVVFLINHEGLPLARTRSGTLELSEDERGLKMRASLDMTDPDVRSIVPKMRRGDLDKMSFAFVPTRQKWKDADGKWQWEKIIDVENEPHPEWPIPVPGVITVILLSMDDKYIYFCNWLHGDIRQYDISDPHNAKLTGQVWMGGLLGKAPEVNGVEVTGGPQMIQLSLDGKRLYVTTSLFSTWDNQFYPEIRTNGGCMLMINCDTENGGMEIDPNFVVDFGKEPNGPSRCHETRYPGGDCTSDIWL